MLHQVGVGALGPVFRTYEPTRDRLVAVKVFRLDITPEQAQSLAAALSLAADAGLFHPSIVEPIAAGVEGTVAYRAEEYVAAESLDVAMRHYAPAPIDKVLPFITQLAGAIDFARTAGIGHGALHPRDIFVTPDEARATGFGVVEAVERVGLRAPVRRPYSAPERVAGDAWSTPADIFSLAAIAYELLSGRRPAGTGSQIGSLTETGVGPHGAAVHAVLARAMESDPALRYGSALEFASALDAASRGELPASTAAAAPVIAAPIASSDEPDPDDAVSSMPPAEHIDEHAEPVRAEQSAELEPVLASEEEPDFDIAVERDEDAAFGALTLEEQALAESSLGEARAALDDEAVEDLALEEPRDATERFADEFALSADDLDARNARVGHHVAPVPAAVEAEEEEEAEVGAIGAFGRSDSFSPDTTREVYGRSGSYGKGAVAAIVALALLVGFAAGYMLGVRVAPAAETTETTVETAPPPPPGEAAAQPFSEQAVAPPEPARTAPPVPEETPAGTSAAAVPPAAPAAPTTGRLVVQSSPSGAGVTVDGRWRGRTPLTLDDLRFRSYRVRVVEPGFGVASEEVALSRTAPSRTLSFRLQRNATQPAPASRTAPAIQKPASPQTYTGSIVVDSRPQGARVFLDGKLVGTTPFRIADVPVGSHVVRLQLDDHRIWSTSTRVVAGQESKVSGSLERIR